MLFRICFSLVFVVCLASFLLSSYTGAMDPEKPVPIPASKQRSGNAAKGYQYLTTGDYVKGGIPYDFFVLGKGKENRNYLNRTGLNATVSHDYTVVKAGNGENLVAPNCMQCHAQVVNDSLYLGMGNTLIDFTAGQQLNPNAVKMMGTMLKANAPSKYEASKDFLQVAGTIAPYLSTAVRGVNAADRLAAVLVAHRDPLTLKWADTASMEIPAEVIPSDVPAWWLLRKKNAMFYNGFGRGDFGRFLMASNLLTVTDSSEAAEVDRQISDVLAFIFSLRPPPYPGKIDASLAAKGREVFIDNCSKCHGKYGDEEEFPNLLIPAAIIQTDSALYKSNYQNPQFVNWFNKSWFAQGDHPARLVPFDGYIAPPLDGVWSTAPYLHNGSVPFLEAVLDSRLRPAYWQRNFSNPRYDVEKMAWEYKAVDQPGGNQVYNTSLNGYGNQGHTFGDKLSDAERKAVLEYLKTI
ncbi:c-type cytochrome [Flavihumibacter sp. UBA7668]|uniref:c-type cytochrome n=1 Tax=Flavihumibacter sp. UBA7668 TaxID=1946542 RepID=UPI0025C53778|nr:c-type cytochrome [Flavihumibacter sp. UBA7668]